MSDKVITRFPPSPTGTLHIGSARTALFNYLFARQNNGQFLLRLEDTDKERSTKDFENNILEGLLWLGLEYDGDVLRQSDRTDVYVNALRELMENGIAYEAEESEKGDGKVIRFKNPNTTITFNDLIRGEVTFDTTELGDFVIARSNTEPLYHLAVVVDDEETGVTHVIRGDDHISNTPRQILILEALGYKRPTYAHIPLILASDKSKLSKRNEATSIDEYSDMGIIPESLVNYLALLGWHPKDDQEIFSLDELIKTFDLSRVQKGGAIFDMQKLRSINKKYIQNMPMDSFIEISEKHLPGAILELRKASKERFELLISIVREHIEIFSDIKTMADDGEFDYLIETPEYSGEELKWKDDSKEIVHEHLTYILSEAEKIEENVFKDQSIHDALWSYAEEHGKGNVLWPLRYALSGRKQSPSPFQLAAILGKDETLSRIRHALTLLE